MSASSIRNELREKHTYLVCAYALQKVPDEMSEKLRKFLGDIAAFTETATSKDIKTRGRQLLEVVRNAVELHAKALAPKVPTRQIARDFAKLSQEGDVWRFGIPFGWIQSRFDPSSLQVAPDLPPHARVGIGPHAGHASVEETFLLEDAYFLVARAEAVFNRMHTTANALKALKGNRIENTDYKLLAALNSEVGTFSRLSVVSAAAFVEAFVNSVGWAEAERKPNLKEEVLSQLRGTHKGRYMSLEAKLERIPKLIRADGSTPIIVSDEKQMKEPFTSFLAETKELRNASMHYAPGKAAIWRPPQEWLGSAQRATEYAIHVAECFWRACYPSRSLPQYLDELSHSRFLARAREHIKQSENSAEFGRPAEAENP